MKFIINVVAVLLISLAFAACQKTNDPVSPSLDKTSTISSTGISGQVFSGDFLVTFKNYRNTNQTTTLNGTINFTFEKTTYSYAGSFSASADAPTSIFVHDRGVFSINGNEIKMADDATKSMSLQWLPSLYLSGIYSYTHANGLITIEGNGRWGSIKISLKEPK